MKLIVNEKEKEWCNFTEEVPVQGVTYLHRNGCKYIGTDRKEIVCVDDVTNGIGGSYLGGTFGGAWGRGFGNSRDKFYRVSEVEPNPQWRNFEESEPLKGKFYQHKDGFIYEATESVGHEILLHCTAEYSDTYAIGCYWSVQGGFGQNRDNFRRVEPVRMEFNVV